MGHPAKGSAFAFQQNHIYAVAWGQTTTHIGFTAATLTQSSGRAAKTNVTDITDDVLAILDGAPAQRWEYRTDLQDRPAPAPIRRLKRRRDQGSDPAEVEVIEIPATPAPPKHRRWGPMAEDLPDGVIIPSPVDGSPLLDHGSMLGLQWQVLRELHRKIKQLERAR
jgi:hypothetical protein